MDEKFQLFSMEKIQNAMNKFSENIFSTPIQNYKTTFIYEGNRYDLDPADYIWLLYQTMGHFYQVKFTFLEDFPNLYLSVYQTMIKDKLLPYEKIQGFSYGNDIGMLRIICDENNSDIFFWPINYEKECIFSNNLYSQNFMITIENIFKQMTNKQIDNYIIDVPIKMNIAVHQTLIFIQIIGDDIYLYGYDCFGVLHKNYFVHVLSRVLSHIKNITEFFISTGTMIRNKKIKNIFINYSEQKTVFELFQTENFGLYNSGYCIIYTSFVFYILLSIICNCTEKIYIPISHIIIVIESYMSALFHNNNKEKLIAILKNFANNCVENYYINIANLINKNYQNKSENEIVKKMVNQSFQNQFKIFFEQYFFQKIKTNEQQKKKIGDLCVKNNECYSEYCEDNKCKINYRTLKPLGYSCMYNIDCESQICKNGICNESRKSKTSKKNLRSVGNPCLYDSQCKTNSCIENVCSGDYEEEMYGDKEDLEKKYRKQWKKEEHRILDIENETEYRK